MTYVVLCSLNIFLSFFCLFYISLFFLFSLSPPYQSGFMLSFNTFFFLFSLIYFSSLSLLSISSLSKWFYVIFQYLFSFPFSLLYFSLRSLHFNSSFFSVPSSLPYPSIFRALLFFFPTSSSPSHTLTHTYVPCLSPLLSSSLLLPSNFHLCSRPQ